MDQAKPTDARVRVSGVSAPGQPVFFGLAVLLLALIYLVLAWSLDAAGWAEGLHVAAWAALGGVLVGALLARVPWPAWLVRIYALVTGAAVALYLGASLLPDAFASPDRELEVLWRIADWAWQAAQGETAGDNLVFVVDVVLLFWWSAIYSARALLKYGHLWRSLVPPGAVLVLNAYYAYTDLRGYVVAYLLAVVVLLAVNHLYELVREWESEHVRYPFDIGVDFLRNSLLFAVLLLLVAWRLPPVASVEQISAWTRPLREGWRRVQEEWGRLFNTLNYQPGGVGGAIPVFPESFNLSGARNLTDTPHFLIEAPKGRYWRAAVYDYYRSTGWDTTVGSWDDLTPGEVVAPPAWDQVELITQTVEVLLPAASNLVAAPMPVRFDLPVSVRAVRYPDAVGGGQEVLYAFAQQPLPQGSTYTVVSLVTNPSASALRQASTDYPDWVRERYLQLPDTLPDRVRQLAEQITRGYDNPYDKARAIEAYLRSIPYNEQIPMPPRNRDAVDWFLFDLREGYCDYFASAMVVMARSVGIPARFASGYARGVFDLETNTWLVREREAHSWPELYFPGYGWVAFEPTPSQPPLVRPENTSDEDEEQALLDQLRQDQNPEERNIPEDVTAAGEVPPLSLGPFVIPIPSQWAALRRELSRLPWPWMLAPWIAAAVLWIGGRLVQRRWEALLARPDVAVWVYARLVRWARRLGVPLRSSQTPGEHRQTLARYWPEYRPHVFRIVGTYERTTYAPPVRRHLAREEAAQLLATWRSLWVRLLPRWPLARLRRQRGVPSRKGRDKGK